MRIPGKKSSLGPRLEWFEVFDIWLAARFRSEFAEVDWMHQLDDDSARVSARPRSSYEPEVFVFLPQDYLDREPYVVAAQVAAQLRMRAEEDGLVPRLRTLVPRATFAKFVCKDKSA